MTRPPEALGGFIDQVDSTEKTLLVVNRTSPEPLLNLLEAGFEDQPVSVVDRHFPEGVDDLVCLVDDGIVEATSSLSALEEAYLQVNADRYRTGTRQLASGSFPDVLTELDEVEFTVRGFPASNKEKLLLVLISRFIEMRALDRGTGTLRTSFQRLSRLDDEYGTRTVYSWLAKTDVETHVYGVADDPETVENLAVTVHVGGDEAYHHSWVVVFTPPEDADAAGGHAALVAVEQGSNVWRGMWTFDAARVERVESYVRREF